MLHVAVTFSPSSGTNKHYLTPRSTYIKICCNLWHFTNIYWHL